MNKRTLVLLLLLISIKVISQETIKKDTVYLDENRTEILKKQFNLKCNAAIFNCKTEENESSFISNVNYNFFFGNINKDSLVQIRNHYKSISSSNLANDDTILIFYRNAIYGFDEGYEAHRKYTDKDSIKGQIPLSQLSEKEYAKLKKQQNKRDDEVEKQSMKLMDKIHKVSNCLIFHIASNNYGNILRNNYFDWIIDKSTEFENSYYQSVVIIKPNGSYFISYSDISNENILKLMKNDWEDYMNDWDKSLETNYSIGYGIIEELTN